MIKFIFHLAKGIELAEIAGKYYIVAQNPIRYVRLNKSLYQKLNLLVTGSRLAEVIDGNTESDKQKVVELIFTLLAKGYLEWERTKDIEQDSLDLPRVSIIIPVRNRPEDIAQCLDSLKHLVYPQEKLEIIVVDDGSTDNTVRVIQSFGVTLICNDFSLGPGECRNIGAGAAGGDIFVFVDSDCTVSPNWLSDIVPYFSLPGIDAVGGFVAGYFTSKAVDRYENAFSSLNMGHRVMFETKPQSGFYVPSCNFFVRRQAFLEINGFNSQMHVGEDVDFCWRLRDAGGHLLYLPVGVVYHKHRSSLLKMLTRRFDYGTSEADLYKHHPSKKKLFPSPFPQGLSLIGFLGGITTGSPLWLLFILAVLAADYLKKKRSLGPLLPMFSNLSIITSSFRSLFSFWYYLCYYFVRYYFILIAMLALASPVFGLFLIFALLTSSLIDYFLKKPELSFVEFLVIYIGEHCFYQSGVFFGCLKQKYFRCLLPQLSLRL